MPPLSPQPVGDPARGKRRRASARLSLALAAFSLLLALPGAASARPFETGISGIGDYDPLSFERTHDAGASFIRLALNWPVVAPETQPANWDPTNPADPHYNWSYIDTGVTEAVRHGLNPVLQVDGAPQWAQRCKAPPGLQRSDVRSRSGRAGAFATAAAPRYSGRFTDCRASNTGTG